MHRLRCGCLMTGFLVLIALGSQPSEAQYTANFQTNIISGVTSNWFTTYIVGSNTFGDVLQIQHGGVLSNRFASAYVAYESNSSNDMVVVTDPGSTWSASSIYVGYQGGGNSVVITNGARIISQCLAGYTSTNNSVLVTGTGSVLSNAGALYIGTFGQSNRLAICDGARVSCGDGLLGTGAYLLGCNSALVTDIGSVWSNAGSLYIGYRNAGNSLVVSNGGQVFDNAGYMSGGSPELFRSSSNNSVVVTGPGSVWNSAGTLIVGDYSSSNSLVICKGGLVIDATSRSEERRAGKECR